jgi:hypothetical protein
VRLRETPIIGVGVIRLHCLRQKHVSRAVTMLATHLRAIRNKHDGPAFRIFHAKIPKLYPKRNVTLRR